MGNLLFIKVHAANTHDTIAGVEIFDALKNKFSSIEAYSADAGYRGTSFKHVEQNMHLKLHISTKIQDTFAVLPKRWIVERTFAWINNSRRLAKDYEFNSSSEENMVRLALFKISASQALS